MSNCPAAIRAASRVSGSDGEHVGQLTGPNRAIADVEGQPGCRPKCNVSEFFVQVMVRL